jgi:hypothetical protein
MTLEEAREQIEKCAADICAEILRIYGYNPNCRWLDDTKFRIHDDFGVPLMTLHIESTQ